MISLFVSSAWYPLAVTAIDAVCVPSSKASSTALMVVVVAACPAWMVTVSAVAISVSSLLLMVTVSGWDRSSVLPRVMVAVAEPSFSLMELWSMVMARVS